MSLFPQTSSQHGQVSDGYHTFDELYEHRCLLFAALCRAYPSMSWKSKLHADGSSYDGWFIAGMGLPTGQITYHLPVEMWPLTHARVLVQAPPWDGHTPQKVCERLEEWMME